MLCMQLLCYRTEENLGRDIKIFSIQKGGSMGHLGVRKQERISPVLPTVSRQFWGPKSDRATGGCRSYSHTSRATLCH